MTRTQRDEEIQLRNQQLAEFDRKLQAARASESQYLNCQFLYNEARQLKLWFFDPQIKRWFTPEEFYNMYNKHPGNDKIFHRIQLKDPFDGIEAAHKQLENLSTRLLIFTRRVISYYWIK